jgi:hypothetical protein
MKLQAIPQAVLDFIGQWLNACIQALFSPGAFGKAETETLPKLLAFAGSSATLAFTLFSLVLPSFKVEENISYLVFVVLLWCVVCFIITGLIKLCGGSQSPAANIAVCLHLSALFYLLEMVVAITAFYLMKNAMPAFELAFIATGSVLSLVYFPIILGAMNDLSFGRKTVFASLCAPLILGLGVLNLQTSGNGLPMPEAAPPPVMSPAPKLPPEYSKPPPLPARPPTMDQTAFNPPPASAIERPPPAILLVKPQLADPVQPRKRPANFPLLPTQSGAALTADANNSAIHPPMAAMAP